MEVVTEVEEGPNIAKGFQQFNLQNPADEVRTLPPTVQSHHQSDVATSQVQLVPTVQPSQHSMDTDGQPIQHNMDSNGQPIQHNMDSNGQPIQHNMDSDGQPIQHNVDSDGQPIQHNVDSDGQPIQHNMDSDGQPIQHTSPVEYLRGQSAHHREIEEPPELPPAIMQNSVSQVEVQPDSPEPQVNLDTDVGTDWCRERVVTQNKRQPSATNSTAQTTGSDGTITVTDRGVLPLWRTIGEWKKLATDADIARFLLSIFFNPKLAEIQSDSRCVHCSTPLTMCCITCLLSAKQPAPSQSSSSGKPDSHLSAHTARSKGWQSQSQDPLSSEDEMEANSLHGNDIDNEEDTESYDSVSDAEMSKERETQARKQKEITRTPVVLFRRCDSSNQSVISKGKGSISASKPHTRKRERHSATTLKQTLAAGSESVSNQTHKSTRLRQGSDSRFAAKNVRTACAEAKHVAEETRIPSANSKSVESLRHRGSARPGGETEDIASSDPLKGDLGSANSTASLKNETESHSTRSKKSLPVSEREKYPICDGLPFRNGDVPSFMHFSEYRCSRCDRTFRYKHAIKRHMKSPDCDTGDEFVQSRRCTPREKPVKRESNDDWTISDNDRAVDCDQETKKSVIKKRHKQKRSLTKSCITGINGSLSATGQTEREKYPICDGKPFRNGDIPAFKHFSEYQCSKCDKTFKYKHLMKRHLKYPDCDFDEEFVEKPEAMRFASEDMPVKRENEDYQEVDIDKGVPQEHKQQGSLTESCNTGSTGSLQVKEQRERKKYPICDGKPFRNGDIPAFKHFSEYRCSKCNETFKYKHLMKRHLKYPDCDADEEMVHKPISQRCDNDWPPTDNDQTVDCDEEVDTSSLSRERKHGRFFLQFDKEYTIKDFMTGKVQIPIGLKYTGPAKHRSVKSYSHYTCEQCHKVFVSKKTYESHRQDHLKEDEEGTSQSHTEPEQKGLDPESLRLLTEIKERLLYCCPHCDRIFMNSAQHKMHVRSHANSADDEEHHPCHFCDASFKKSYLLTYHQRLPETKRVCQQCGLHFKSRCQIRRHKRAHKEENRKKNCEVCGKSFDGVKKREIRRHMKIHKEPRPMSLCTVCGKSVLKKRVLAHMRTHTDHKPFSCTLCSKTFKTKAGLLDHAPIHGEKTFQCETCGAYFYRATELERHRSYKHLGQVFECKECGRRLSMKRTLENHIRIVHRKVKPYVCSFCGLSFANQRSQNVHMRSHTGEKPYQCPHCPSRFARRDYMKQHVRTHTGERPYGCEDCGQRFTCRTRLTLHRRNRHSDKMFPCTECEETFPLQSSLDFHCYNEHGGNHPSLAETLSMSAAVEDIAQQQ